MVSENLAPLAKRKRDPRGPSAMQGAPNKALRISLHWQVYFTPAILGARVGLVAHNGAHTNFIV